MKKGFFPFQVRKVLSKIQLLSMLSKANAKDNRRMGGRGV